MPFSEICLCCQFCQLSGQQGTSILSALTGSLRHWMPKSHSAATLSPWKQDPAETGRTSPALFDMLPPIFLRDSEHRAAQSQVMTALQKASSSSSEKQRVRKEELQREHNQVLKAEACTGVPLLGQPAAQLGTPFFSRQQQRTRHNKQHPRGV